MKPQLGGLRTRAWRAALICVSAGVGTILVAPTLIVPPMSFTSQESFEFPPPGWSTEWYSNLLTDSSWQAAIVNSLVVALIVTVVALALGTAAAFAIVRGRFRGKAAAMGLILAPQIVPAVLIGLSLYVLFLNWHWTGSVQGFVIAHTIIAIPYVVVLLIAGLQSYDVDYEFAAASLGASPVVIFTKVTLPLMAPSMCAGALFAFTMSMQEVVISLFIATPSMSTLPVALFNGVNRQIDPTVAAASTVMIATTLITLVVSLMVLRTRGRRQLSVG